MSQQAGQTVFETRKKIGEMFSADEERVIFTKNCTESLNTAIKGVLKSGDHVLISSLEHNSVLRPVEALKNEIGVSYDVVKIEPKDKNKTLSNFKKMIKGNTKLIVCTHVSNVFGTVLPIREISKIARENNILFILDAAQSAGTFEINMEEDMFDIVCAPGHKGLFGPLGTGIMLLSKNISPKSLIEGGTGSFSMKSSQPDALPDKYESGTLNYPGIAGLSKGIDFINAQGGVKAIYEHEKSLTSLLITNMKNIKGVKVYDFMHSDILAPVISFNIKSENSETVASMLDLNNIAVRGGFHCSYLAHKTYKTYERGTVRLSPGYFNTKNQINFLCFCLNKIAKQDVLC